MKTYIYFSGTGNTKFVLSEFSKLDHDSQIYSIEDKVDFESIIKESSEIVLGFPIYTSMMPSPFTEFLNMYKNSFRNKIVNTIITQMMFSGDGAMLPLRYLKDQNIQTGYTVHFFMPNNISDVSFLPIKSKSKVPKYLRKKVKQIEKIHKKIMSGKSFKHGRRWYSQPSAYVLQRAYGERVHNKLKSKWNVSTDCINCQKCVNTCPVSNLKSEDNTIVSNNECIVCYRCLNICPTQAIRIVGSKKPSKQHYIK